MNSYLNHYAAYYHRRIAVVSTFLKHSRTLAFTSLVRSSIPKDPYSILGVPRNATPSQIKSAYFELSKKLHPDVSKHPDATAKFTELTQAYNYLSDPLHRSQYEFNRSSTRPNPAYKSTHTYGNMEDRRKWAEYEQRMGSRPASGPGGPFYTYGPPKPSQRDIRRMIAINKKIFPIFLVLWIVSFLLLSSYADRMRQDMEEYEKAMKGSDPSNSAVRYPRGPVFFSRYPPDFPPPPRTRRREE